MSVKFLTSNRPISQNHASTAHRFNGAVLIASLLIGFGLTVTVGAWRNAHPNQSVPDGHWARAFEGGLDQALPLRQPSIDAWGALEYNAFKNGRSGVIVGQSDWLYSDEEFAKPKNFAKEIQNKLNYVQNVKNQLDRNGAKLIVVIVPAKVRVYPEHLGPYRVPQHWQNVYTDFLEGVRELGVIAPDTLQALRQAKTQGDVFLRTDTHWTPSGARAIAKAVAIETKNLGLTPAQFTEQTAPPTRRSGDLLKFIPMGRWQNNGPQPDTIRTPIVENAPGGDLLGGDGGLLGTGTLETALVGTSYSANKDFNFEGALKLELHADVLNAAKEGKGPVVPMREFLAGTLAQNPVKLVIWEIPERFLPVAYPEEKVTPSIP